MIILATWATCTVAFYLCISIFKKKVIIGDYQGGVGSIYKSKWAIGWSLFYLIALIILLSPFVLAEWQHISSTDLLAGIGLALGSVALIYKTTWGQKSYRN